jgi:hypothetical protein
MQMQTALTQQTARKISLIFAALTILFIATPMHGEGIICCSESIGVGGSWTGSNRLANCQEYFNSAPTAVLRRMCQHRQSLGCINMQRCSELPPEDAPAPESSNSGAASPSDPARDGLEQGFYGPPPPPPPAPPAGQVSPPRLVYLIMWPPAGNRSATSFTVWLDRGGCPLALDHNNRLADSAAARHVVRGRVMRRDGRVQIEAEAQERPGGARLGPFTSEAEGEDAAAVAKATRAVTEKLKLVCAR